MYLIKKIFHPDIYQGRYKRSNYFEGWYFKLIDRDSKNAYAIIPGIAFGSSREDAHAFIQVADAASGKSCYFRYPLYEFRSSKDRFEVDIAGNSFTRDAINISLHSSELDMEGNLRFSNIAEFPRSFISPGIMGPFGFIPFMECYHDVINIHHEISGSLCINNVYADFTGGFGYIEKDWGSSFPEMWIWLQSNHFNNTDASVMLSVAKIPWLRRSFTGFISFLRVGKAFYRFATYTGARISKLNADDRLVTAELVDKRHSLLIMAENRSGNSLKAPKNGHMATEITESITSTVDVVLKDAKGNVLFTGSGRNTGIEIAGNVGELIRSK